MAVFWRSFFKRFLAAGVHIGQSLDGAPMWAVSGVLGAVRVGGFHGGGEIGQGFGAVLQGPFHVGAEWLRVGVGSGRRVDEAGGQPGLGGVREEWCRWW